MEGAQVALPYKISRFLRGSQYDMMRNTYRTGIFFTLAVLGVALSALTPWIHSHVSFPAEPFDVSVIYRSKAGDIQYFPLIAQLARGTITDGTIKESEGSALRSFPPVTLLPHAICIAAFGKYGFLVADMVITIGYFILLVLLFRTLSVSRLLSTMVALFLALQMVPSQIFNEGHFGYDLPLRTTVNGEGDRRWP